MIRMPRRNVTRFFIPLIDVLILLFCIFLLMEFNSESAKDEQVDLVAEQSENLEHKERERVRLTNIVHQFQADFPKLNEMDKMRKELEELRNASKRELKEQWLFQIIDVETKGQLVSYYDRKTSQIAKLENDEAVKKLVKKHLDEANGRKVYYLFEYPRGKLTDLPTTKRDLYYSWFTGPNVKTSLPEPKKDKQ